MKKVIAGVGFLLSGTLLYLFSSYTTGAGMEYTTEWITSIGRYWQTAINLGLIPLFVLGALFGLGGAVLALWGVFSKSEH